jgi:hypothetical protein
MTKTTKTVEYRVREDDGDLLPQHGFTHNQRLTGRGVHLILGLQMLERRPLAAGQGDPASVRNAAEVVPPQAAVRLLHGHAAAIGERPVAGVARPDARYGVIPDTRLRLQQVHRQPSRINSDLS